MDDFNSVHRFTEEVNKVLMLAQAESRRLGVNWVGTEHILLGLIREGRDAATVLKSKGVNLEISRVEVEKISGRGCGFVEEVIPFTPRAKKVLELSLQEADQVGQKFISTPILLLALTRITNGISRQVLVNLGIDIENIRYEVLERFFKDKKDDNDEIEILNFVDSKIELKDKCEKKQSDKEFDNNEENDLVSQLERLASLKERGLLTNKEYIEVKRRLLF